MDLRDVGHMNGGCEGRNCSFTSSISENCSDQDCFWEEPMFGLVELVSVTVIYIPLMLFGLLGNILTILVVWLRPHMRSSTYLYLSSMAVSDLLILLLLPLDLYKLWRPRPWPLGDLACKLTMFLSECCTFCTILHITFLSLERYLAVCWPITAKTMVTRHRTRVIIGCLWLGAAISAAPVLVMVGVEDVGMEELGLSQWREDGGWTGEFTIGGGETHMALLDAGLDGIQLGEKETRGWDEDVREVTNKSGAVTEWKREGKTKDEEERDIESVGEQQNKKKEDEGGGEQRADGGSDGEIDRRECRCTHYAISSGLLAAMMILSNLYFLVPLCILGLVYSLIGRTLWLRPKSSRRDQSHRNTVKMLGMIVLAFVLCWLPFHVGRTILSLSLGSGADSQEVNLDTSPHFDALTDRRTTDPEPFSHTDEPFESLSQPGEMTEEVPSETHGGLCDECEKTKTTTQSYLSPDEHLSSHVSTQPGQDSGNTNVLLHPNMKTKTHNDYLLVTQKGNTKHFHNTTNTNSSTYTDLHTLKTHTDSHPDAHTYFLYYLSQYLNLVSSVLFYLSAAVNPLLYNLMSARYRLAVHSLVHKHSHTHTHRLRMLTSQHSTTTL